MGTIWGAFVNTRITSKLYAGFGCVLAVLLLFPINARPVMPRGRRFLLESSK